MRLATLSVRHPVAAAVAALLLAVLGAAAILRLPVRETPDVDPPIVSVNIAYPGASAAVIERDVTEVVEDNLSGIEDVAQIRSTSRDGFSQIDVEFALARDLDAAAADVRDRVGAVRQDLPEQVEPPTISKASAEAQAMMWITLTSESRDRRALTDVAIRQLVDPLSIVPGVAQVIVGGERRYAMRIRLDRAALAAHGVTVPEVVAALRAENVELPGGRIDTAARELSVRTDTKLRSAEGFRDLVIRDSGEGQVRLADLAEVELGAENSRSAVFRNGEPAAGLGIVRQSGANTLAVADGVRQALQRLEREVPADVDIAVSYDQSVFIEGSIREVVKTLLITAGLVIAVILLFLGSLKAVLVPAAIIPGSLLASFSLLLLLGFSINTLTLLALVLAIGLVVDDAIVVLESSVRQREAGMARRAAAVRGTGEVGRAVLATTAVLVAVLLPITVASGTLGRLFTEFAVTLATALAFSAILALTLGAALAAALADPSRRSGQGEEGPGQTGGLLPHRLLQAPRHILAAGEARYARLVGHLVRAAWFSLAAALLLGGSIWFLLQQLPSELAPKEDRAAFVVPVALPQGANLGQTLEVLRRIDGILQPHAGEGGPIEQTISIAGTGRQGPPQVNQALVIVKLKPWGERETGQQALLREVRPAILALPGARAVPISPAGLVPQSFGKPVQFVISGPDYDTAHRWARQVAGKARELDTLKNLEVEFNRRSPQVRVTVDRRLAADLGVSVADIGTTLRVFLGGDDVTEFYLDGETYEVMVRGAATDRDRSGDIGALFVRAGDGAMVPLAGVIDVALTGTADSYRRIGRQPSIVLSGVPADGADLGGILDSLDRIAEEVLPQTAGIGYLGLSREFRKSSGQLYTVFGLGLVVVYLVLSALFGSFLYPVSILLAVPLSVAGGLAALTVAGLSLNIYSQIALLLLVGLLAKNAILIVDLANRRRQDGMDAEEAVVVAARTRFRPIVMTSIATLFGAVPLALATGPGAEARQVMGLVIMAGVVAATLVTLLVVPGLYRLCALIGAVPGRAAAETDAQLERAADERRDNA